VEGAQVAVATNHPLSPPAATGGDRGGAVAKQAISFQFGNVTLHPTLQPNGANRKIATGHFSLFLVLQKVAGAKGFRGVHRIRAMVDVLDHPILVDHEGDSVGKQTGEIEDTVSLRSCLLGVAEDWEGCANLGGEYPVRLGLVDTYSEHLRLGGRELGDISLIRRELFRSTRRARPYVKGQDYGLLSAEIAQPYGLAILVLQREVRRPVSNLQLGLRIKREQHATPHGNDHEKLFDH